MNKNIRHLSLSLIALLSVGWLGWQEVKAQGADLLPVKYVRIEGAFQHISKKKIKQVVTQQVMNGLYNVDVQQVRQLVEQLPWIRKVKVKRVWPDAINIRIKEQTPVVRWGEKGLLNKKGQAFMPDNIKAFNHLPLLHGHVGNGKTLLDQMKKMSDELIEQGMKLTELRVNERGAWRLKLDNSMEVKLGRNQPQEKFKRFLKTFDLIGKKQINKVAVVDLRYANGYALTWKQGEEKIDWKQVSKMNKT